MYKDRFWTGSFGDRFLDGTWLGHKVVARGAASNLDKLTKGKYPAPYQALESVICSLSLDQRAAVENEAKLFSEVAVTPECKV